MAAASVLVVSHPTSACSGPPLTFDAAVSGSELIVEGTVEDIMFDGLAFRLAVKEVFKGPVGGPEVRIGPTVPEGRGCEVGLQVGQHVVLGVVDIHAQLNSLATAIWFVAEDGSLSSPGSLWEVATDIEDLRAKLRQAVPDTALPFEPQGAPAGTALTVWAWRLWSLPAPLPDVAGITREFVDFPFKVATEPRAAGAASCPT